MRSRRPIGLILCAAGSLSLWLASRMSVHTLRGAARVAPVVLGLLCLAAGLMLLNDSIGIDPRDDEPLE